MTAPLHAVALAVAVDADGPLAGALILGEAGAGKSSLALAAIEGCPFRRTALVADDQVLIDEALVARAPDRLQGLIEIRGLGPAPVRSVGSVRLIAALELGDAERVAEPRFVRRSALLTATPETFDVSAALLPSPACGRGVGGEGESTDAATIDGPSPGALRAPPSPAGGRGLGTRAGSAADMSEVRLPLFPFRWTGAEATAAHRLRALIRSVLSGQYSQHAEDGALVPGAEPPSPKTSGRRPRDLEGRPKHGR